MNYRAISIDNKGARTVTGGQLAELTRYAKQRGLTLTQQQRSRRYGAEPVVVEQLWLSETEMLRITVRGEHA